MKAKYTLFVSIAIFLSLFSFIVNIDRESKGLLILAICIAPICVAIDWHDNKCSQSTGGKS